MKLEHKKLVNGLFNLIDENENLEERLARSTQPKVDYDKFDVLEIEGKYLLFKELKSWSLDYKKVTADEGNVVFLTYEQWLETLKYEDCFRQVDIFNDFSFNELKKYFDKQLREFYADKVEEAKERKNE